MSYSDLLKDPRWQKRRLEIMNRDNFTCQKCSDQTSTLNVHHIDYKGLPWEAKDLVLITLCEKCHKEEEQLIDRFAEVMLKTTKANGLLMSDYIELILSVYEWNDRSNGVIRERFIAARKLISKQNG